MAQAETVEAPTIAGATDILFKLNETLLGFAESPWFRALERSSIMLGRSAVGSSTTWEVPAADGAVIYATRDWNEYKAPVGIDGAHQLELSLQRPGEVIRNHHTDGVGYYLWPDGVASRLCHDGYAAEQCENEVLTWAGADSPASLVQYIDGAIHHGRINRALHRTWSEYGTGTPKRRSVLMLADLEETVVRGQTVSERSLDIIVDKPGSEPSKLPWLSFAGIIAEDQQRAWALTKLEALGAMVDVYTKEDTAHQLTSAQWDKVWRIGASTLNRSVTDVNVLYERSLAAHQAANSEI